MAHAIRLRGRRADRDTGDEFTWLSAIGRETIEYREGDIAYCFNAGWEVRPPVLDVPSEREWREWVPEPFRERREEIVGRVAAAAVVRGHVIHHRS